MSSPEGFETRRFVVAGRVQGVGFRAATRQRAVQLGLQGFVTNLGDGRVEVQATGPGDALAQMHDWLARGPRLARVDEVQELDVVSFDEHGFVVVA